MSTAPRSRSSLETGQLTLACSHAQPDPAIIRNLLAQGANPNAADIDDWTLLHQAAGRGDLVVAQLLLDHGAHHDPFDRNGMTPLHLAVRGNQTAAAHLLIAHGADPVINPPIGRATLHLVCRHTTDLTLVDACLAHGAPVDARDVAGRTPLMDAAQGGCTPICVRLLAAGAQVQTRADDGETPLHAAAWGSHHHTAACLLTAGADPLATNARGQVADPNLHATAALLGHQADQQLRQTLSSHALRHLCEQPAAAAQLLLMCQAA